MYSKLDNLIRFGNTLREPYKTRFLDLIKGVYQNISGIVYTNSLDDDEMIIYAMLSKKLSKHGEIDILDKEKFLKCISILLNDIR